MSAPARVNKLHVVLAGVFVVAVGVRFAHWAGVRGTPLDQWHRWAETDMATYLEQARRFAAGDLLGRDTYHPYHNWQKRAGPPEAWERWYGTGVFHQAPAYSHVLAAIRGDVPADSPVGIGLVKTLQLLLGGLTCVLLALLARELVGETGGTSAAIAAGGAAALYAPLYYLEIQLLREGPAICAMAAILLLCVRQARRMPAATQRATFIAAGLIGILLGAFWTFHEMGSVLIVATVTGLAGSAWRTSRRRAAWAVAGTALGVVVGFGPLLIRNVRVGAPPFSVSCRMPINFAESNIAGAADGGAAFSAPGPEVATLLDAAGDATGRVTMGGVLRGVWRSYDGDVMRMMSNWWQRFRVQWTGVEIADNTSLYFYREHSPILRASLDFRWVMGPGAAAIAAVLAGAMRRSSETHRPRSRRESKRTTSNEPTLRDMWRERGAGHGVVLLGLALVLASLTLVHSVGRFRLYLAVFFIMYTGVFVGSLAHYVRRRRFGAAAALIVPALALSVVPIAVTPARTPRSGRPSDYAAAASIAMKDGQDALAAEYLEQRARFPAQRPQVLVNLGNAYARLGRWRDAAAAYQRALTEQPGFGPAVRGLNEARRQLQGAP